MKRTNIDLQSSSENVCLISQSLSPPVYKIAKHSLSNNKSLLTQVPLRPIQEFPKWRNPENGFTKTNLTTLREEILRHSTNISSVQEDITNSENFEVSLLRNRTCSSLTLNQLQIDSKRESVEEQKEEEDTTKKIFECKIFKSL